MLRDDIEKKKKTSFSLSSKKPATIFPRKKAHTRLTARKLLVSISSLKAMTFYTFASEFYERSN